MKKPTKKEIAAMAVEALKREYPDALCSLDYSSPLQLIIAARLSAQCTDARVNLVTPALFERYKTVYDFATADPDEVAKYIHSCGFYATKSRDIVGMCKMMVENYGGNLPDTMDELLKLPGIGRKTANLIMGDVYGKPAVVTDTHMIRLSNRLGLVKSKEPKRVEDAMRALLPAEESNDFCHRTVLHGRAVCTARKAHCDRCCMADFCQKKI